MPKRSKFHVVPSKKGGWNIKKEGQNRASKHFDRKQDAVKWGREKAKQEKPSQIIIHKKDGKIQSEHTYKKDPFPPKG